MSSRLAGERLTAIGTMSTGLPPVALLRERVVEDAERQVAHQALSLSERNEVVRGSSPRRGCCQRTSASTPTRLPVLYQLLGLVVQEQLIGPEREPQVAH